MPRRASDKLTSDGDTNPRKPADTCVSNIFLGSDPQARSNTSRSWSAACRTATAEEAKTEASGATSTASGSTRAIPPGQAICTRARWGKYVRSRWNSVSMAYSSTLASSPTRATRPSSSSTMRHSPGCTLVVPGSPDSSDEPRVRRNGSLDVRVMTLSRRSSFVCLPSSTPVCPPPLRQSRRRRPHRRRACDSRRRGAGGLRSQATQGRSRGSAPP